MTFTFSPKKENTLSKFRLLCYAKHLERHVSHYQGSIYTQNQRIIFYIYFKVCPCTKYETGKEFISLFYSLFVSSFPSFPIIIFFFFLIFHAILLIVKEVALSILRRIRVQGILGFVFNLCQSLLS